jgi:GDPmannose 4,6-dehydratase
LEINNLNAIVDWGAAEDFVQAMWLTLRPEKSDHYLISTGISHTVLDFVKCAFNFVNRSHELYVTQKVPIDLNSNQTKALIGDNSKIRKVCKWNPETSFEKLVHEMVSYQIDIFKNRINDTN